MQHEQIIHLNMRGGSGRVVRFRMLDMDEVEAIEANGARGAGEEASYQEMRAAQLKLLVPAFIVAFTEPNHPPLTSVVKKLKPGAEANSTDPADFVEKTEIDQAKVDAIVWKKNTDQTALANSWSKIFTVKDTRALRYHYIDLHDIQADEVEMLTGKAIPAPTGV
jgi:hypothetical protein